MLCVLFSVVQGVTKQTIGLEQTMRHASLLFAAGLKHCTLYSGLHRTHALYSNMLVFIGVHVCFDTLAIQMVCIPQGYTLEAYAYIQSPLASVQYCSTFATSLVSCMLSVVSPPGGWAAISHIYVCPSSSACASSCSACSLTCL